MPPTLRLIHLGFDGFGEAGAAGEEEGADEGVDIAVEDAIDVAGFHAGAQVLDHAVGLQDVRADLAAEADAALFVVQLGGLGLALFDLELVELGAQELHGDFAVLELAALVLALHDDAGGDVGEADGGLDFVDVLAAVAAGAEGVDANVVGFEVNFNLVVDFRGDEDGGERGVAAGLLVEGRDAHQAVHAALGGQQAVGVFALDQERGVLDARFLGGGRVQHGGAETAALRPAQIHAHEHLGPVLGVNAAGAGLDGDDGVQPVVFAGEQRGGFQLGDPGIGGVQFAGDFVEQFFALGGVGLFVGELEIAFQVVQQAGEFFFVLDRGFSALAVLHGALGGFLVLPEVGASDLLFEGRQALAVAGSVKDSSAPSRCAVSTARRDVRGLREPWDLP